MRIRFIIQMNFGGSIPSRVEAMISKKQAGFVQLLVESIAATPNDYEESFNNARERIERTI